MAGPDRGDAAPGDPEPAAVALTDEQRAAALHAGAPKVPRRVVAWAFVVAAILALGGTVAERLVSAAGLNPTAGATTTTTTVDPGSGLSPAAALLSFDSLPPLRAPSITLPDQHGRTVSLRALRGKVVVLTFLDASCKDACPVIAAELRRADHDLGARRDDVVLLTINTDPLRLAARPVPPVVTSSGLASLSNWHYLTGSERALNTVWRAFGVTIEVYTATRDVVHNDVLYLVARDGDVVARGSPFSDESHDGAFTLPPGLERIAGDQLASSVARLLGPHR